ncbi:hypothetical protein [Nonomuraea sp. NPDC048916]
MKDRSATLRRLSRAAMFAAIRGIAAATGSAIVAIIIWWLQNN